MSLLYVDADNCNCSFYEHVINDLKRRSEKLLKIRVYGDFHNDEMKSWYNYSLTTGLEQIQCPRMCGKNSTDLRITCDIMQDVLTDSLCNKNQFNQIILLSSDCDFTHVAHKTKNNGKSFIVYGRKNASPVLKNSCSEFRSVEEPNSVFSLQSESMLHRGSLVMENSEQNSVGTEMSYSSDDSHTNDLEDNLSSIGRCSKRHKIINAFVDGDYNRLQTKIDKIIGKKDKIAISRLKKTLLKENPNIKKEINGFGVLDKVIRDNMSSVFIIEKQRIQNSGNCVLFVRRNTSRI